MKLRPEILEPLGAGINLVPHSRKILAAIWREPHGTAAGHGAGGDGEVLRW